MATAYSSKTENGKDKYELELSRVREKIKTKFVVLVDCLKARESELLRELDNILTDKICSLKHHLTTRQRTCFN